MPSSDDCLCSFQEVSQIVMHDIATTQVSIQQIKLGRSVPLKGASVTIPNGRENQQFMQNLVRNGAFQAEPTSVE